jgi:hypothetical protein
MDDVQVLELAPEIIRESLLPIAAEGIQAFDDLIRRSLEVGSGNYLDFALAEGKRLTPGVWAAYLVTIIGHWSLIPVELAKSLSTRRQQYVEPGDTTEHRLVGAATEALAALKASNGEGLVPAFHRLAQLADEAGKPDRALILAALTLDLGAVQDPGREKLARYTLALALAHDRPEAVAGASVHLAGTLVHAASQDLARRVEAFDSVEAALERLWLAPETSQETAAAALLQAIDEQDYLSVFKMPLCLLTPACKHHSELAKTFNSTTWPKRISEDALEDWLDTEKPIRAAQWQEMQIDLARLQMTPQEPQTSAKMDWTASSISHSAFRRAIPHNRSFLREAEFDRLLLVLSHEMTHVLSVVGAIGNALNCLRVAAYDAELQLWAATPGMTVERIKEGVAAQGVAKLLDSDAGAMFRTEQSVELALKTKILQDVWMPWFEGLAVFGEIASDPTHHKERNSPVTEALRALIDFHGQSLPQESPRVLDAFLEHIAEFELRCSQAISRLGPSRLRWYVDGTDGPYLAGYVAVRSVVAAWRARRSQGLTGTEAFMLLLDATRQDTFDAIPDLSLRSDLFAAEAEDRMVAWVTRLAQLDTEGLAAFLDAPASEDLNYRYEWQDGNLEKLPLDAVQGRPDTFRLEGERRLKEALASLTRPEDIDRIKNPTEHTAMLVPQAAYAMHKHFATESFKQQLEDETNRVYALNLIGSLLPIGSSTGRFFVNRDPNQERAALSVQLVTTEKHVTNRKPSINVPTIAIEQIAAEQIAKRYQRSAEPRLAVTRLIDLTGTALGDAKARGIHVLAYRYGDWFEVRGPTTLVDKAIRKNPTSYEQLCKLVHARLYPTPIERQEVETLAKGDAGAQRTLDWITRSTNWHFNNVSLEVSDWAARVKRLASDVLDVTARRPRQQFAAEALLLGLLGDAKLAQSLAHNRFEELTTAMSQHREDMLAEIFKTAQRPSTEPVSATAAKMLDACGLRLLVETQHGWDVRPAISLM